jgi:putative FmdB family regulatory protein
MPLYTYRCDNCGVQFDERQRFEDPVLEKCPECGKKTLRKLYLPVEIVFKGSGFYATDHRSASGANGTKRSEKKSDSAKDDTAKTDAKKAESKTTEKSD